MAKEINENKNTVIVYNYRYMWKQKDGKLCVRYICDIPAVHEQFIKQLRENDNVVSSFREYVNEVNFEYIGFTEAVKEEKKEKIENETEN